MHTAGDPAYWQVATDFIDGMHSWIWAGLIAGMVIGWVGRGTALHFGWVD